MKKCWISICLIWNVSHLSPPPVVLLSEVTHRKSFQKSIFSLENLDKDIDCNVTGCLQRTWTPRLRELMAEMDRVNCMRAGEPLLLSNTSSSSSCSGSSSSSILFRLVKKYITNGGNRSSQNNYRYDFVHDPVHVLWICSWFYFFKAGSFPKISNGFSSKVSHRWDPTCKSK